MRDEAELLPGCVEHLRRIGVGPVLVLDNGSTDGGLEYLAALDDAQLKVIDISGDASLDADACEWRDARALRSIDADWVLLLDADEFWLPTAGRLDELPDWDDESIGQLEVPRFNVALTADGPLAPSKLAPRSYADVWMFAGDGDAPDPQPPGGEARWIERAPAAKVAVRPGRVERLRGGWHNALGAGGEPLPRRRAAGLIAAHLPFTTVERFRRKVDNIRELLASAETGFKPNAAGHWRRWAGLVCDETVVAELARQRLSPAEVAVLRDGGSLRSAEDLLARLPA